MARGTFSILAGFATTRDWSWLEALHHQRTTTDDNFLRSHKAKSCWNRTRPSKAGDTSGFRLRGRVWLSWRGDGGKQLSAWTNQTRPASVRWTQRCLVYVQLPRVRKQSDNSETGARHTRFTKPRLREKKGSEDDCRHGLFLASQDALEVVTVSE